MNKIRIKRTVLDPKASKYSSWATYDYLAGIKLLVNTVELAIVREEDRNQLLADCLETLAQSKLIELDVIDRGGIRGTATFKVLESNEEIML